MQYYILTRSEHFKQVLQWLEANQIAVDIHLNRSRFSIPSDTRLHTEFCLRFSTVCHLVDPRLDLATGFPLLDSDC